MKQLSECLYGLANKSIHIGEIRQFAGSTAPSGWKICNGEVISRSTFAKLFTAIGTTYGGGDGSTTFAIPDFRGRTSIGADPNNQSTATGHSTHELGQKAGEETHTLDINEIPNHAHGLTGHASVAPGQGYLISWMASSTSQVIGTSQAVGGSGSHNIMQPFTAINYIIYTGVA